MRIPSEAGWLLYDGDCGFCVKSVRFWYPTLRRLGFQVDTLQADWTPQALGLTREEALRDVRLLTTTGATYAGADVYLYVARRIWWAWPFAVLFGLPGFKLLIRAGYRWLTANRYCVSEYCRR